MSYKKTDFEDMKKNNRPKITNFDKSDGEMFIFNRKIDYINGCLEVVDDNFENFDEKIEYLEKRIKKHALLHSILTGLLILCIIIISSKLIEINDTLDKQLEVNEYLLNRVEFREVEEYGEFEESEEISEEIRS